jgi:hypothetical protein
MSTGNNPLLKERINISDVESGLRHIYSELPGVLEAVEKHKNSGSGDSEMQFIMQMSGLELLMTNISREFRESFIA